METGWQERFTAVVDCVYAVLSDVHDKNVQIKEDLLAKWAIGPLAFLSWPSASDTHDHALDLLATTLCDKTNAVMTGDKTPAVERWVIPATFAQLKQCIEAMQVQVPAVEAEYLAWVVHTRRITLDYIPHCKVLFDIIRIVICSPPDSCSILASI
jgi:hypothetical protein